MRGRREQVPIYERLIFGHGELDNKTHGMVETSVGFYASLFVLRNLPMYLQSRGHLSCILYISNLIIPRLCQSRSNFFHCTMRLVGYEMVGF